MLVSGIAIHLLALGENGGCLTGVALRWRHKFQPAVLVLVVVPAHKLMRPRLCCFQTVERLVRIIRSVLASTEQRFRIGVVVEEAKSTGIARVNVPAYEFSNKRISDFIGNSRR